MEEIWEEFAGKYSGWALRRISYSSASTSLKNTRLALIAIDEYLRFPDE